MTPLETLKTITDIYFDPITKPDEELIIKNFNKIEELNLISGNQIEVEGYISYIPRELNSRDKDLHFNLSPSIEDDNNSLTNDTKNKYLVCEIQNALLYDHKIKLEDAKKNKKKVRVKGYFRIFLEHIDKDSSYPHIFEIHPVTSIWIEDKILQKISVDCPAHNDWRDNESIYEMI